MDKQQEQELRARTNPVFNTAKATVMNICLSGDPDARLLAERLGIGVDTVMGADEGAVMFATANRAVIETRYRVMNALIQAQGKGTVVDLPCGYTPRALNPAFRETHYIGCDLPAVIDELAPAVEALLRERGVGRKEFHAVDATNYRSLRQALDTVQGEVCVTTEGLIMYLSDSELAELCAGMRSVLREFGGCWLAYDPESSSMTMAAMRAVVGEAALKTMLAGWKALSDKSDLPMRSSGLNVMNVSALNYENGVAKLTEYLRSMGLRAERIPIGPYLPELHSTADLPEATRAAMTQAVSPLCVWKITAEEGSEEPEATCRAERFEASLRRRGGALEIALRGRLDSITASELLAAYEKAAAAEKPERIVADASGLEYISSAGLRVLLILLKQVGQGNLTVTGQNETVEDIFQQTGFADLLGGPTA